MNSHIYIAHERNTSNKDENEVYYIKLLQISQAIKTNINYVWKLYVPCRASRSGVSTRHVNPVFVRRGGRGRRRSARPGGRGCSRLVGRGWRVRIGMIGRGWRVHISMMGRGWWRHVGVMGGFCRFSSVGVAFSCWWFAVWFGRSWFSNRILSTWKTCIHITRKWRYMWMCRCVVVNSLDSQSKG